jgi:hypothetical protein
MAFHLPGAGMPDKNTLGIGLGKYHLKFQLSERAQKEAQHGRWSSERIGAFKSSS